MPNSTATTDWIRLNRQIVACEMCSRLRQHCRDIAVEKRAAFRAWDYWGQPVPNFGDPAARLLMVGLAPAAHGANRTGRMFTGDRSGDWLYGALYRAGFANQPTSEHRSDGLKLTDCYITAAVHCAPPDNKPELNEFRRCRPYLVQEWKIFHQVKVVIVLGKIAFDAFLAAYQENGGTVPKPRPMFGHGATVVLSDGVRLICSYHPSQQNTFTGKLTQPMFQSIFDQARAALGG
jgi:uracil-DNA glycosylase